MDFYFNEHLIWLTETILSEVRDDKNEFSGLINTILLTLLNI